MNFRFLGFTLEVSDSLRVSEYAQLALKGIDTLMIPLQVVRHFDEWKEAVEGVIAGHHLKSRDEVRNYKWGIGVNTTNNEDLLLSLLIVID